MRETPTESAWTEFYANGMCELSGLAKCALDQEIASLPKGEVSEHDARYPADAKITLELSQKGGSLAQHQCPLAGRPRVSGAVSERRGDALPIYDLDVCFGEHSDNPYGFGMSLHFSPHQNRGGLECLGRVHRHFQPQEV